MSTSTSDDFVADHSDAPEPIVVGIGASAGGIRACRELFAAAPTDAGIAWVVILHLSPEHESHLASVLQHTTSMPVSQVTDRQSIEPDHVYVIPPNRSLAIADGRLLLSETIRMEERRAPVDVFLRTLAEARRGRSACVILSGTGANGSSGLRRVKEEGGIVIAQEPHEAEYDDMPRHAIATGLVDVVLPVAEIPRRIVAYRDGRLRVKQPVSSSNADGLALHDILTQLRRRTGHDFSNYKRAALMRRIERRLALHQLPGLTEYARTMRDNPDEPQALLRDLLISVTNFFRDRPSFDALEKQVIGALFEGRRAGQSVRAWVPACATGEEAYSIAMLLAERSDGVLDLPAIQVFATDLDERSIAQAREALYTESDVADVSPERLRRFFNRDGVGYRVRRELREMVLFAPHNILRDPPFSHLDLVSCRNLLIYLDRTAQQRVMELLHFALNPGGFLFLGTSESIDGAADLFLTVDKDARIYQSRGVGARVAIPVEHSLVRLHDRSRADAGVSEPRGHERISYADLHHRLIEQYGPPSLVVNEDHHIVHLSERAGRYLSIGGGEMSTNLLRNIRPELRMEVRTALHQAIRSRAAVETRGIAVQVDDRQEILNVIVRPVLREGHPARGYFLVVFEEAREGLAASDGDADSVTTVEPAVLHLEEEVIRLKAQLRATVEQYETQAEEAKAGNEELQAMNEELRSAAEELETSKEELQSINEELTTVNQELKNKIEELSQANNDVRNLVNSTDIGAIFLDRALRVKFFTPRARDGFNLIAADVGRPLSDITTQLVYQDLLADAERVLRTLQVLEREVETRKGRRHLMRLLPYRTAEERIDGVVLTLIDITELRGAEGRERAGEERLRLLIESAEEYAVFTLTSDNAIDSWNLGAERVFGYAEGEILGQPGAVLFTPEDRAAGVPEEELREAREHGRSSAERWQLRKDGTRMFCGAILHAQKQSSGLGFVRIARDLSVLEQGMRATEELETRVRDRTASLEGEVIVRRASEERTRQLLRHVVTAQEDERRRVARDLHDQLGQQLTALRLGLDRLAQTSPGPDFERELSTIQSTARRLDSDVSFLAWELRPAALDDLGLVPALEQYVAQWSRHYGIETAFHAGALRLDPDLEASLYRIAQEALNNIAKHAQASRVEVLLEKRQNELVLIVEDNGIGFKPEDNEGWGLGLLGISERATLVEGTLEIESKEGEGTTVFVRFPLPTSGGA